jgi:oligosaccharide translocation protein RFT1
MDFDEKIRRRSVGQGTQNTDSRGMERDSENILTSAATGATALVSATMFARLVSFVSNVLVARSVDRAALGVGTLRLNQMLFLGPYSMTTDGLRKVAYRGVTTHEKQSLVNLCWTTIPFGLAIGMAGAYALFRSPPEFSNNSDMDTVAGINDSYSNAIYLTLVGLLLIFLAEPMYLLASSQMMQELRAKIETFGLMGDCFVKTILIVSFKRWGVSAFGIGLVVYGLFVLLGYLHFFYSQPNIALCSRRIHDGDHPKDCVSLFPRRLAIEGALWCTPEIFSAAKLFWFQSIQKWVLENGENVAIVFLGTAESAGEYILVANLGSLVARLLLKPIEEMALAAFSKLSRVFPKEVKNSKDAQKTKELSEALFVAMKYLVLGMTLFGLLLACFAPAYSHLLIFLLYGSEWSRTSAPMLLGFYCVYVMTMALNGILEAFVQGVEDSDGIKRYNLWLLGFSVSFLCFVFLFIRFGPAGLILANILKMICRILVCVLLYVKPFFVKKNDHPFRLHMLFPHRYVFGMFAISVCITQASLWYIYHANMLSLSSFTVRAILHVVVGIICITMTALVIWIHHGKQLKRGLFSTTNERDETVRLKKIK